MPTTRWIPILLLALPVLELYLLFRVAAVLGFWTVLLLLAISASLGLRLLQAQSLSLWSTMQQTLARGEHPTRELLEGTLMMLGAVLLIIPGFLTDLIGLALLLPPSRRWLVRYLADHGDRFIFRGRAGPADASRTIDGEFRREK